MLVFGNSTHANLDGWKPCKCCGVPTLTSSLWPSLMLKVFSRINLGPQRQLAGPLELPNQGGFNVHNLERGLRLARCVPLMGMVGLAVHNRFFRFYHLQGVKNTKSMWFFYLIFCWNAFDFFANCNSIHNSFATLSLVHQHLKPSISQLMRIVQLFLRHFYIESCGQYQ